MSREDWPTDTSKTRACEWGGEPAPITRQEDVWTSHMDRSLSVSANSNVASAPGSSTGVFLNPLSVFRGPGADEPMYTWTTLAPATAPVFVTLTVMHAALEAAGQLDVDG